MPQRITRSELEDLIAEDQATVVEALSPTAFAKGHLPGALQLGNDDVEGRATSLLPDKTATIVTSCSDASCQNSAEAAGTLEALGYTDVREYVEGKADWADAGLPLEQPTTTAA